MRDNLQTVVDHVKGQVQENNQKYKNLILNLLERNDQLVDRLIDQKKAHTRTVLEYETGKKQPRGEIPVSKDTVKKKASEMREAVLQYANSYHTAKERVKLLRQLSKQKDIESLSELSMTELKQATLENAKDETKKKINEAFRDLSGALNTLESEYRPSYTPEGVDRETRESVRPGVEARLEGLKGHELGNAFQEIAEDPDKSKAYKSMAAQVVRNRLERDGHGTGIVDQTLREKVWSDEKREQFERFKGVQESKGFAQSYRDYLRRTVNEIEVDELDPESVADQLDVIVEPFMDEVRERL